MKKVFACAFLLCISLSATRCQPVTIVQIEYSKESRGYQEHIRITPDSLTRFVDDREHTGTRQSRHLEDQEWQTLLSTLEHVELEDIDQLVSPTALRASDAAMHSTLSITTSNGQTCTHGFDDENPHDVLKPLLKAVRELAGPAKKP